MPERTLHPQLPEMLNTDGHAIIMSTSTFPILDEPLAVLGHVSPREAARSDAGRSKVVDWLKDMENHVARSGDNDDPMADYDFGWIWRELGVAEERV